MKSYWQKDRALWIRSQKRTKEFSLKNVETEMIINVLANHEMYLSILPFEQRLGMTDLPRHGGLIKDNFCLTIMSLLD